jgi:hypothetical protein
LSWFSWGEFLMSIPKLLEELGFSEEEVRIYQSDQLPVDLEGLIWLYNVCFEKRTQIIEIIKDIKLNRDDLVHIWKETSGDLNRYALEKLNVVNLHCEGWAEICSDATPTSNLESLCLKKIDEQNLSYNEWVDLAIRTTTGSRLEILVLMKISESAETPEQLIDLWYRCLPGSEINEITLYSISKLELLYEQWESICNRSPLDLESLALSKMSELAASKEQWLDIYKRAYLGTELKALALQKSMGFLEEVN